MISGVTDVMTNMDPDKVLKGICTTSTVRLYLKKLTSQSIDGTSCLSSKLLADCQLHLAFFIFDILWFACV